MISWFIIFICWVVSFVFGGIEAGLLSLDQVRLRHQVKLRNRSAILLDLLLKKPERLLATILLVTNLADIAGLLLLTKRLVGLLGATGYAVALLVAGPIYLFLLGVLPKSLFRRFPYRALAAFAGLLVVTSRVLWPVLELGAGLGVAPGFEQLLAVIEESFGGGLVADRLLRVRGRHERNERDEARDGRPTGHGPL